MTEDNLPDIHSRIDRIEVTLTHAVDAIDKITQIVNKPQETKWGPIMTAISLIFFAASGYTTLITMPMNDRAEILEAQVLLMQEREIEYARKLGYIEGKLGIDDE